MVEQHAEAQEMAWDLPDASLAAALRQVRCAIAVVEAATLDGTIAYCNEAFSRLTGYRPDEVVGRPLDMLVGDSEGGGAALAPLLALRKAELQLRMRRRNGDSFWSALSAAPVLDKWGKLTHIVVSHVDVTAQREREEAARSALRQTERASEAKTRLIAVAGHDLRQPLQTIAAALELLHREPNLSERARRLLTHAEVGAADLDEELKALAQVADVQQEFAPKLEDFPLKGLFEQVDRAWRARAEHKGLDLRIQSSDLWVRSDSRMLQTVVRNFVGNAIKYTVRGKVLVGVRRIGENISLQVWDTGPGISPKMVPKIFGAFERADAPGDGLGLGLWIAQRTADLLGHRISVRSRPQKGSCFAICMARADSSDAARCSNSS